MKYLLQLMLLLVWPTVCAAATPWTADNLPMVHLEDARRYVCNPDGVLSEAAVDSTDAMLFALERDKGVQTVVVVVKRIAGGDAYSFGMELGRKYGVGSKTQSTGLIIVLSTEDRAYQFLTGNGLEATLPDAICRRIQNRVMVPELRAGNWDAAIVESVRAVAQYVRGDSTLKAEGDDDADDVGGWVALAVVMVVLALFIFTLIAAQRRQVRTCPSCHRRAMKAVKARRLRTKSGKRKVQTTWRCEACGHTEIIESDDNSGSGVGGAMVPPLIFGSGRSFGGGGGFTGGGFTGGGSFGGGSFGGGGSGGRF